jgi:hypothetical protein
MAICIAMLNEGNRCTEQATESSNYCEKHRRGFYRVETQQQQQQQHGISTQQQQQQQEQPQDGPRRR